jgi:hypothetical protein
VYETLSLIRKEQKVLEKEVLRRIFASKKASNRKVEIMTY